MDEKFEDKNKPLTKSNNLNSDENSLKFKTDKIHNNKEMNMSINLNELYDIKPDNFITFVKYFSLKNMINETNHNFKKINNYLAILIDTKNILIHDNSWNLSMNSDIFNDLPNKMNATYVCRLVEALKNNIQSDVQTESNSESHKIVNINTYKSTNRSDLQLIKKDENLSKSIFQSSACSEYGTEKTDIIKSLSKLFNYEAKNIEKTTNCNYLRIICIIGATLPIDMNSFRSIMDSFSKNNFFDSAVLNFLLLENDFYFTRITKNEEMFNKFTDFKEENDYLGKSTKKINYLLNVYKEEEAQFKNLSDRVYNFSNDYLNLSNNKATDKSIFLTLLHDFINKFDTEVNTFKDFYEAFYYSILSLRRKELKYEQSSIIRSNLDEAIQQNTVKLALDKIKTVINEIYKKKEFIQSFENEVNIPIKNFKEEIELLEKKINMHGDYILFLLNF